MRAAIWQFPRRGWLYRLRLSFGGRPRRGRRTLLPLLVTGLLGGLSPARAFDVVHSFRHEGGPAGTLIQGSDGNFYGTTLVGGESGAGTVFRMDSGGNVTTLHSFNGLDGAQPFAGLLLASDGSFYGTTSLGGASAAGTIFRMSASGEVLTLHAFSRSDGAQPMAPLIEASNGAFYGTTSAGGDSDLGTVFRMDRSGEVTTLHSFGGSDGANPIASLLQIDGGHFLGTTSGGGSVGVGTVFDLEFSGSCLTVHEFDGVDGHTPSGALIRATDGNFYGTTANSIFRMDPFGGVVSLHEFSGTEGGAEAGLIQATNGELYGTTMSLFGGGAVVYEMGLQGTFSVLHQFQEADGEMPYAGLVQGGDGNLYGATLSNGAGRTGTLYRITTSGDLTTLYAFPASQEGVSPQSALLLGTDRNLYGTTGDGGTANAGTIFRLDASGAVTTLHSFGGPDGSRPRAPLIQGRDGSFYGTTPYGGAQDRGTIFKMDAVGDVVTLHSFPLASGDGYWPLAALVESSGGDLYGTTSSGGEHASGAIFKMDSAGVVTILHSFDYLNDGAGPGAALVEGVDGSLYGTTRLGGANAVGTVFRMDPTGNFKVLHSFTVAEGSYPSALIQGRDGFFYGTTTWGGTNDSGTVYRMDSSGNVTTLHSFLDHQPTGAALLEASDGGFYGVTNESDSGDDYGTVFRLDRSGSFATVHEFRFGDGAYPGGALIETPDRILYGTTSGGGLSTGGIVFRIPFRALIAPPERLPRSPRTVSPRD